MVLPWASNFDVELFSKYGWGEIVFYQSGSGTGFLYGITSTGSDLSGSNISKILATPICSRAHSGEQELDAATVASFGYPPNLGTMTGELLGTLRVAFAATLRLPINALAKLLSHEGEGSLLFEEEVTVLILDGTPCGTVVTDESGVVILALIASVTVRVTILGMKLNGQQLLRIDCTAVESLDLGGLQLGLEASLTIADQVALTTGALGSLLQAHDGGGTVV
jgi:hypothetical protein